MNDDFPYFHELRVRFRDVDMMKHVNNSVYLTYLEEARSGFWEWALGDMPEYRKISYILASVSINFRAPAFYREYLNIHVKIGQIGRTSFSFLYEIKRRENGDLVADAESAQVMYDYREKRKYSMPGKMREILQKLI